METLTILNNSPMVTELFFCFQNDVKANTYFLEPMNMILKPSEKQVQPHEASPLGQDFLGKFEALASSVEMPFVLPLPLDSDRVGLPHCSRCLWRQYSLLHQGEPRTGHLQIKLRGGPPRTGCGTQAIAFWPASAAQVSVLDATRTGTELKEYLVLGWQIILICSGLSRI